ncbi:MAG TPA: ABC transporter permease [Sphingobium sp.]|jgi:ABC-2 type transport system permease protein|uniref:ABC transporter permease n=1 Tax=unclassified Sphingobium TaxID=2611147 RepID=UPI0007F37181|nr:MULTISPECIES: ABC transporter permease [unclassified Sphingobium]OAN51939.1 ABC transporter permease [Sphingobium sp. TCM1]WIW88347.1 ABC transporter permease [Sphingobium sp. V4]HAF41270.1 ABC transporter permease [Sphingobium sp.]
MKELWRAAYVIARRDFTAVVLSRTFILFLLGPLLPILIGFAFGGLGEKISSTDLRPIVGVAMAPQDSAALARAHRRLTERMGEQALPRLQRVPTTPSPRVQLARADSEVVAILSGTISHPVLTGKAQDLDRLQGDLSLISSAAKAERTLRLVQVERQEVATSLGAQAQARLVIGRIAQVVMFFLTILLAGMILSNLVEEKTNKIIEILAAAVPIDAIFLGKLMAMLAMSFVGIAFWGGTAFAIFLALGGGATALPAPAVGWPVFLALAILYFAMAYTLLGSLFLGIGAQAATVREVQTLNMPITMGQMLIFFFASYAVDHMGSPAEVAACIFPFSSPFAMIARAAQDATLWPHLVALVWQATFVALIIRVGVLLFRRHVMQSGGRWWKTLFRPATG